MITPQFTILEYMSRLFFVILYYLYLQILTKFLFINIEKYQGENSHHNTIPAENI